MDDGFDLLTGPGAGSLLRVAVEHGGGKLKSWSLDHVDTHPEHSTTATYLAKVEWSYGERTELLGVSARVGELSPTDTKADIFADGNREVAVWIYPNDPDLPGLPRAAFTDRLAELLTAEGTLGRSVSPEQLRLSMIGYRPRRRAVVRLVVDNPRQVFFIKALRPKVFPDVLHKHQLLSAAGVPSPEIALHTKDQLIMLRELPGRPLARAIFDEATPCTAQQLIDLLDSMPTAVTKLERRPPWSDAVAHYASMVISALPEAAGELNWAVRTITAGLAKFKPGQEPTHGDFHEGQLRVAGGKVVGILDVDTIGPGRRADDLACLIAHLSTIQRMNAEQEAKVRQLLADWVPVFDSRVDPVELRLRAAAVIISLATGPYRGQEPGWQATTWAMIRSALALLKQVV